MAVHSIHSSSYQQTSWGSDCPELFLKILGIERIRSMHIPSQNADMAYQGYAYRDDLEKYKELRLDSSTFVFSCKNEGILKISEDNVAGEFAFSYSCGYDRYTDRGATGFHTTMKDSPAVEEALRNLFKKKPVLMPMIDSQLFERFVVTLELV
ncbi:MAG TPA: hypothetical protein VFU89_07100 [Rhabdochlamydiaceae bacterium]|nr:hypothetical protein [Rhabdochlamydiaceae bacterium]